MIENLDEFERDIAAFDRSLSEDLAASNSVLGERLLERVKELTPRDTGETAEAWRIEKGSNGEIEITNPLPHAPLLEHGSSEQAPHGMVAVAVAEVEE